MPRKSKGKFKPYKNNTSYSDAEVFRNSSAVLDDTDPYESLKYMKDVFKNKLDEDVISMIFSECAYNVDQAFETLMSLCNDEDGQHHFKDDKLIKNGQFDAPVFEGNDTNSNSSACQLINSSNIPKQTKSKLAINFSPPSERCLELPYENGKSEVFENNYQHTLPAQNQNADLGYNYTLNKSDSLSVPFKPDDYTSYVLINGFGNIFSTSFYPSFGNTSSSVDVTDSASAPCESFKNTGPQFITPHLPTPLYKHGSSNRTSPNSEASSTFWDLSKKFHHSSPKNQNSEKKQSKAKEAAEKIKSGSHILVILRGLPGSGKSFLARKLKFSGEVFSTDDFFMKRGEYVYNPFKLGEAHAWNKRRTKRALEGGVTPVIIDNTNVEAWEITPYVLMGKKYNYEILILEPDTPWKFNVHQLSMKTNHGVPKAKIAKMKERYQHNVTVENLLASINLLDLKNIDNSSDDSEFNKVVVKNEEGKIVDILGPSAMKNNMCLEADIHQEEVPGDTPSDETAFEHNLPLVNSLFPACSNVDDSFENENAHSFNRGEFKQNISILNENSSNASSDGSVTKLPIAIHDLDDLRALAREDSEDSQSSANSSSQDISCWEAITERDDDFLWSRSGEIKTSTLPSDNDDTVSFMNLQKSYLNFQTGLASMSDSSEENSISKLDVSSMKGEMRKNSSEPTVLSFHPTVLEKCNSYKKSSETVFGNTFTSKSPLNKVNTHVVENIKNSENITRTSTFNEDKVENLWIECDPDDTSLPVTKLVNNTHSIKKTENSGSISRILTENKVDNLWIECDPDDTSLLVTTKPVNNTHSLKRIEDPGNISRISTFNKNKFENLWIECDPDDSINDTSLSVMTKPDLSSNINKLEASFECLAINEENLSNKDDGILIVEPKPPRNHDHHLNVNKNIFVNYTVSSINTSLMDAENSAEWSIIEDYIQEEKCISESEIDIDITPIIPKPQREIFENKSVPKTNSIASPKPTSRKSFFNLSVDAVPFEWSFPDYICTDANENTNLNESPLPSKITMDTQTEPCDFAFMYKVSVEQGSLDSCNYTVLSAKPYTETQDTDSNKSTGEVEDKICLRIVTFDKSTCTSDLINDIEVSQKLRHLHDCFSDISTEDLTHLLEICNNDETWISNLLLEWGYKYNVLTEDANNDVTEVKGASNESKGYFGSLLNKKCEKILMEKENDKHSEDDDQPSTSIEPNSINMNSEHVTPPNAASFEKLHLVLDPAFAYQLEELFGPVTSTSHNANRCVEIDLEFAQLLHSKWKVTQNCTKTGLLSNEVSKVKHSQDQESSSPSKKGARDPLSLSEIMDMEYALQLHKQERLKKDTDFATKLKRLELYSMFPGADPIALDEIFESHNYSLKDCIFALSEDIGQQGSLQLHQKQNIEKMDQCVIEWSKSRVFQEFENGDYSEWVYKEDNFEPIEATLPVVSSTISPEASDLRELATKHYKLRQEFIAKAQTAYCRGMKDVASFYAQKGGEHGFLFKDANKKASVLIAQQRNMSTSSHVLDLHGLYVQEAIPALEKFLREKKLDLKRRQQSFPMTISVITGQGLHSMRGPKLRPSVVEYLKRTGYIFYEINRGMVEVTVTPE